MSRQALAIWCCDTIFSVATRPGHGREALCRDMELVSRQGWPFGCRDIALGVATGQAGWACRDRASVWLVCVCL